MAVILSNLDLFSKFFHPKILLQICCKVLIRDPTKHCMCWHTILWNIDVRKQAINDKLQGSVTAYSRCGGIVNNHIKKGLLLNLPVIF